MVDERSASQFLLRCGSAALVALGLATGGCGGESGPAPQTAGDSIASAAPSTDVLLAPLDTAGGTLSVGPIEPVTHRPGYDNQPAFTLDGSGLLWTSIRGDQSDVYRRSLEDEDTSTTQLTQTPESEYSPTPRSQGILDSRRNTSSLRSGCSPETTSSRRSGRRMSVVRVEPDGRQRLWDYTADGEPLEPLLPDADSVGYYAWLDQNRVALFVLGSPPTLHVANVATGTDTVVASRIGRSLRSVPGEGAVSFVRIREDSTTALHLLEEEKGSLRTHRLTATPGPGTGVFHAWTPGGALLLATEDTLQVWRRGEGEWRGVASLDEFQVTRLAVSPTADWVALVDSEE